MLIDLLTIFAAVVACTALYLSVGRREFEGALAEEVLALRRDVDRLEDDLAEFARLAAEARMFKPMDIFQGHP